MTEEMHILSNSSFLIILVGTCLLSTSAGIIGCLSVHKGQSLIGDAIGHATFPGIIISFMLKQSRVPHLLLLGAILAGVLCYILIHLTKRFSKLPMDAAMSIFLSGFFGLGMVLKSFIQGNPNYQTASQSGIESFIFGQAAFMLVSDVKLILIVSVFLCLIVFLFFKEFKLFLFDEEYGNTIGFSSNVMHGLLLIITIALIAVSIQAVGVILISSLLIMPCVAANQWSERFEIVISLVAGIGGGAAFLGTLWSSSVRGISTGPAIIVVMGSFCLFSLLYAHIKKRGTK